MALSVLDGNQTATTLSSVVTGGEHIVAHSVVSLGANAIANITSAVSGSAVSVSNFPATQTIAGTVTANTLPLIDANFSSTTLGAIKSALFIKDSVGGDGFIAIGNDADEGLPVRVQGNPLYVQGSPIGNPLSISGTVTANIPLVDTSLSGITQGVPVYLGGCKEGVGIDEINYVNNILNLPAISGTVTVGAMPNGSLTTRFGTPTTANTAFATSAVTNTSRKYLLIQNVTTQSNVITVGIGFTPTTTQGIQLTAGAGITFESSYIPTGAVQILSSVTASNFTILEA